MKKTDLEKNKGLKIAGKLAQSATPARFAAASAMPDRREQRRLDQAAGLVAFAAKLPGDLLKQLDERARSEAVPLNDLVARLLRSALDQTGR
jgi:hypothetical protein